MRQSARISNKFQLNLGGKLGFKSESDSDSDLKSISYWTPIPISYSFPVQLHHSCLTLTASESKVFDQSPLGRRVKSLGDVYPTNAYDMITRIESSWDSRDSSLPLQAKIQLVVWFCIPKQQPLTGTSRANHIMSERRCRVCMPHDAVRQNI